ncbi:la-related protein 4 isoform X2 [Hypanus sabinus]|uniref:la-related protein 4 isoform X2 n=1 Tax=Hypanus sabinus TaxID=79690 RepID=UPI0028C41801|nr:la-related protein 4 isoform X2 [Hypanus sabinus]
MGEGAILEQPVTQDGEKVSSVPTDPGYLCWNPSGVTSQSTVLNLNTKVWQKVPPQLDTASPSTHDPLGSWRGSSCCISAPHSEGFGRKGTSQGVTPGSVSEIPAEWMGALDRMDGLPPEADRAPEVTGCQDQLSEDLRTSLRKQLEFCFSWENLSKDLYLVSQMDSDHFVPICTIANIEGVKKLTTDLELILDVLRSSPLVQVDEKGERARPNHKRCIIILREVPESTPVEDVQALFNSDSCPNVINCEFAHNNSWYITFQTDSDAQQAFRYLREEVKTFQGKPILARIKAKPMAINTFFPKNGYRGLEGLYPPHSQQAFSSQLFLQPVFSTQQHYPVYSAMPQPWTASQPYFETPLAPLPNSCFVNGFSSAKGYKSSNATVGHVRPYHTNRFQGKFSVRSGHLEGLRGYSIAEEEVSGLSPQVCAKEDDEVADYEQKDSLPQGMTHSVESGIRERRGAYRGRKRREEDRMQKTLSTENPAQKVDLELSNFPPLPGSVHTSQAEPHLQNRMADVVKGLSMHKDRCKDSLVSPPGSVTNPAHVETMPQPVESSTYDPMAQPETVDRLLTVDLPAAEVGPAPPQTPHALSLSVSSTSALPSVAPPPEPRKLSYAEVCQKLPQPQALREGHEGVGERSEGTASTLAVGATLGCRPLDGRTKGRGVGRRGSLSRGPLASPRN